MLPYLLLFFLATYFALVHPRMVVVGKREGGGATSWRILFLLLTVMIGLRYQVGGDWLTYLDHVINETGSTLGESLSHGDPAYSFLNWIAAQWGDVYLVNSICAALFTWGLVVFCRAQPYPWLALVSAIPYLVIVVAMGYTRQGVAIGLAMVGLVALGRGKILYFVFWIVFAALFHKSAVILAPLAILASTKRKIWVVFWVLIVASGLYVLLLQESVDSLKSGYLEAEYQSSGAAIRIAMNALPAMLLLLFRRRFNLPIEIRAFWNWMALGALSFIVLLEMSPSSTAVDRVALYWIPLQLFVWSRLPIAIGQVKSGMYIVIVYSFVVMMVWLLFAQTAFAWLPYRFFPLEWLFS